ncbi:MAG: hypothetical protein C0609_05045 [Deltaproteobacteria bacterium]|nr:MAG: hypothetical protein C0609_05045 [Deltaproteobacteria bacterium]
MRGNLHPGQLLVISFFCAIMVGTAMLTLPASSAGAPLSVVDALFTATSATCVTGLIVVDTAVDLTSFGQGVVLALIQLGGLGIMTFTSLLLLFAGRRFSFKDEEVLTESFGDMSGLAAKVIVSRLFLFVLIVEFLGALALFPVFIGDMGASRAIYTAIFHSISAFCNAGFSIFSNSLVAYRNNLWLNGVIMTLIILGGTGFVVFSDLWGSFYHWRKKRGAFKLSLHSKTVLFMTVMLIFGGAALIATLEWKNGFRGFSLGERITAALFQSVTTRTAGFNTIDIGSLTDASLFLCIILMFIGAGPGSCAGGVKTSTVAVVLALFWGRIRGFTKVSLFKRSIPDVVVNRAVAILVLSFVFTVSMTFLLLLFESHLVPHNLERQEWFLELMFEVVSAFGTVGLSTGVTPELSPLGKLILTFVMFTGRLGPLTLALALGKNRAKGEFSYAEENMMVG